MDAPVVGLGGQAADVSVGAVAGGNIIHGADPGQLVEMIQLLLKNDWDDRQDRDVRQTQADYHREMTRQRLERIAADVAESQRQIAALARLTRRIAVALAVVAAIIIGLLVDRGIAIWLSAAGALALGLLRGR